MLETILDGHLGIPDNRPRKRPSSTVARRPAGRSEDSDRTHGRLWDCPTDPSFHNNYIRPALSAGLVEMIRPESSAAKNQKYRLAARGRLQQASLS